MPLAAYVAQSILRLLRAVPGHVTHAVAIVALDRNVLFLLEVARLYLQTLKNNVIPSRVRDVITYLFSGLHLYNNASLLLGAETAETRGNRVANRDGNRGKPRSRDGNRRNPQRKA